MASYKSKFGRFEVKDHGNMAKWFVDYEKALAYFDEWAEYPEEIAVELVLTDIKTGEILKRVTGC